MRSPLKNRLLGLLTLLLFAAGIFYQPLCSAGFIDCPPCHEESTAGGGEEEGDCPTCQKSAQLAHSTQQPTKSVDAQVALFQLAFALAEQFVLTAPESPVEVPKPQTTDTPKSLIIRDIKRSIPIRGPSITA
ncbi:hypothetical protein DES53_111108 [Roseimicrobium gellanilyticum]|uniref:Uncharacterized protein n=1 Tax=Roseimicrobium gellanilyticum TaxID=748857 RepID=A0A366H8M5_9BACT|nr:hypothetical protein [Roseimicrobium gellanilyticum]RBP38589.1 hypothetical protein DES53_111108 [Roseimicrobium gellanilyticum]